MKKLKEVVKPVPCMFCSQDIDERLVLTNNIDFGVFGEFEVSHMIAFSYDHPHIEVEIDQPMGTTSIYYDDIDINFCPLCGRNLLEDYKKGEEDE